MVRSFFGFCGGVPAPGVDRSLADGKGVVSTRSASHHRRQQRCNGVADPVRRAITSVVDVITTTKTTRGMDMRRGTAALIFVLGLETIAPGRAQAQALRRNLDSFFIFAQRTVRANDLKLDAGCNVGVNCAKPS